MPKILIIADDLTGAAECAAACGPGSAVVLDDSHGLPAAEIVAIDGNTRRMSADRAAAEVARLVRAYPAEIVYKKIDSTLRGHIGVEIAAGLEAYRGAGHPNAAAVVAPAFPAMGRMTRGGKQYARGVEIDRDGLPELLDAETDDDLRGIVRTRADRSVLWVGSAGLMRVLTEGLPKPPPPAMPKLDGPIVFAIGSRAERTREQVEALPSGAEILVGEPAALARDIAHRDRIGALVLTGGDTARAVLHALGVSVLRIAGDIEIGVPLLLAEDSRGLLVVTKAGDFGDRETLLRCWRALR